MEEEVTRELIQEIVDETIQDSNQLIDFSRLITMGCLIVTIAGLAFLSRKLFEIILQ